MNSIFIQSRGLGLLPLGGHLVLILQMMSLAKFTRNFTSPKISEALGNTYKVMFLIFLGDQQLSRPVCKSDLEVQLIIWTKEFLLPMIQT